jgi:hypothetical protein
VLLNAKQHLTLAHYIRQNQQQRRDMARAITDPAWQMKRSNSFLTLARLATHRAGTKMPRGGVLRPPQLGGAGAPHASPPRMPSGGEPPPAITGTPGEFGARLLAMQRAMPHAPPIATLQTPSLPRSR